MIDKAFLYAKDAGMLRLLSDDDCGKLFRAILQYLSGETVKEDKFPIHVRITWEHFRGQIDADQSKREHRNARAARFRERHFGEEEITPNNAQVTPNNAGVTPNNAQVTPNNAGVTPNNAQVTPNNNKERKRNEKETEVSPLPPLQGKEKEKEKEESSSIASANGKEKSIALKTAPIAKRISIFGSEVRKICQERGYPADLADNFLDYWTAMKTKDLMLFEWTRKQTAFDLPRRLSTWARKDGRPPIRKGDGTADLSFSGSGSGSGSGFRQRRVPEPDFVPDGSTATVAEMLADLRRTL